jgi:ribonuclease E
MKRMLFNATHAEELRVAIVDGQRLVDLDIETAGREQRKSNIYKGVVTRVEPSLEACFVNYGEDRHGFLPFKEIAREYFRPGVDSRASIKEAIAEGTELLVQVEKEERGNKGAALTTYISLAGRYLVLMPNNPKGGGVSRRIEGEDRQELKEAMDQLQMPSGMSIIARTAGIGRTPDELQWDLNYLLQLWKAIDDARNLQSGAYLIFQESSLVIRAIRDYFHPDIGEILIDTDDIYEQARQFMLHVMPDMAARVKRYRDDVPLFSRFQIEHQIETAYSRQVALPSGGALVIDHTEALVAVDVNSARATKGSDIEETALRTNLEAADEVGRQLRLRDLGGLIVIDFIDMESAKAQREVEQRLRDALHHDRARVQMGKISRFGLMELSRQRLRPALNEGSHMSCPRCNGTGVIRDTDSSALHILRILQEEAMKEGTAALHVQVPVEVASFLLNEKRTDIAKLEARLKVTIVLIPNKHLETPNYTLERLRHDDPRLEEAKASYAMADGPAADSPYLKQKEEVAAKPRQEAVVKGITPSTPAPVAAPRPARGQATEPKPSFLSRLFSLFMGSPKSEDKPAARTSDRNGGRQNRRGGNNGRGGDRSEGREGRQGRDRGQDRGQDRERAESDQNRQGRGKRGRGNGRGDKAEGQESRQEAVQGQSNNQQAAQAQGGGQRGRRGAKPTDPSLAPDAEQNLNAAVNTEDSGPVDGQSIGETSEGEGNGRRRRRRRGSRGRGQGEDGQQTSMDLAGDESVAEEPSSVGSVVPVATPTEPAPVSVAPATPVAPVAPVAAPEAVTAPVAAPVATPVAAPEPIVIAEVAPTPAPVVEPVDPAKLNQVLDAAGLQWVQTDPNKAPVEAIAEPPPQLGRKPKRSQQTGESEPMVMVETRSSEQPPAS